MNKPRWILEAERLLGIKEVPGIKANEEIIALFRDSGHEDVTSDETAWCAAAVGGTLARAGFKNTGSLAARSYEKYGKALSKPEKYCIGVMKRGDSSWQGHVGYVLDWDKTTVTMLGGNQSDGMTVAKFPRNKFLAFRWPVELEKTDKEIVSESRHLSLGQRVRMFTTFTGLATLLSWENIVEVKTFVSDYAGLIIFGMASFTWLVLKYIEWMNLRSAKEGRYVTRRS